MRLVNFRAIGCNKDQENYDAAEISAGVNLKDTKVGLKLEPIAEWTKTNNLVRISGLINDALGVATFPRGKEYGESLDLTIGQLHKILSRRGFWTDTKTGKTYTKAELAFESRLSTTPIIVDLPIFIHSTLPSTRHSLFDETGQPIPGPDNGSGDFDADHKKVLDAGVIF